MMRIDVLIRLWGASLLLLSGSLFGAQLQPLNDEELGEVVGREGVLVSLEYYLNSDPTTGEMDTTFCSGGLAGTNCRFTWQIQNRDGTAAHSGMASPQGEWMTFKDGFLTLDVKRLSLDASFLGDADSAAAGYESWFNASSFSDASDTCLIDAPCDETVIQQMPGLRTHYPETGGSYDPGTGESTGYDDVRVGLYIGGLAIEYGATGYLANANGSFAGFDIRDNNGSQAGIAFGGDFYLSGF